jgi:hypothetical protein
MSLVIAGVGCSRVDVHPSTFLVTTQPVTLWREIRSCVAINPTSTTGVWWWQPHWNQEKQSTCECRSTGPDVFPAEQAVVEPRAPADMIVKFRIGLHSLTQAYADVELVATRDTLRHIASGHSVRLDRRSDLAIPECR